MSALASSGSTKKKSKLSYQLSQVYIDKTAHLSSSAGLDWSTPNRGTRNAGKYKFSASMLYAYNHNGYKHRDVARTNLLQKNFPKVFKRCLTIRGNDLIAKHYDGDNPPVLCEHFTQEEIIDKILDDMPMLTGEAQPPTNRAAYHQKIGNSDELILQVSTNKRRVPLIRGFIDETSPAIRSSYKGPTGLFSKAIDEDLEEKKAITGRASVQELLNTYSPFIHSVTEWKKALMDGIISRCMTQSGTLHEEEETLVATAHMLKEGLAYEPDLKGPHEASKWFHKLEGEDWIIYGLFDGRLVYPDDMKNAQEVKSAKGNSPFKWGGGWMKKDSEGKIVPRVAAIYEAKERQYNFSGIKKSEMVQIAIYHEMIRLEFRVGLPVMLVETKATTNTDGVRESKYHMKHFNDDEDEAKDLILGEIKEIVGWFTSLKSGGCEKIESLLDSVLW